MVDGVNVSVKTQFAPVTSVDGANGQPLDWAKSPGLFPENVIALMVNGPVPLLVRVTDCVALVVATN